MEIIDDLEPARRGLYGGAVGYLDFAGNMDAAIAIRTAVLRDGVAHVQAGAGLVADSVPADRARRSAGTRPPPSWRDHDGRGAAPAGPRR